MSLVQMRKLSPILLGIITLVILASCDFAISAPAQSVIMSAELTTEQREIIDLLSSPKNQDSIIFDFNTEEAYRDFDVWVEVYEYGELIDRPAGTGFYTDTPKKLKGKAAIVIHKVDSVYEWTLSAVEDGAKYSHAGTAELNIKPAYGNAFGPMDEPANIEADKEIVIYSSTFAEANTPHHAYNEKTLQEQPELLKEYPVAFLIKCKVS